ncbi:unnamed protein product [Aphanomyces euteiches]|uniref:Uncharacterized protein n=1 Tax=Aphanomyces euteiches TaxID=100861 RepID=A0A6G0WF72_9STRA|nr:hypothetical protein Ae201684_015699 [Aphanomyces euteiches]KAH9094199.1 hypothetical protein Ae201684P_016811 [Aphanomyces euteiches]
MRDKLTTQMSVWSGLWVNVRANIVNPFPNQAIMAMGFFICMGFHYEMVLPLQFKDDLCAKLMVNGRHGRLSAVAIKRKYTYLLVCFWALASVPSIVAMMTNLFPELCCIISTIGFILEAFFDDLKEHMADFEERMKEELEKELFAIAQ